MHADLMHPDIVLEDFKAHQRELWHKAERQLLTRQVQPHNPQWGAPRLREKNAIITSRHAEHAQEHSTEVPQRILVPFDWSTPAYQALEEALALAKLSRARLTLLRDVPISTVSSARSAPLGAWGTSSMPATSSKVTHGNFSTQILALLFRCAS
jgi:hypothetical protein